MAALGEAAIRLACSGTVLLLALPDGRFPPLDPSALAASLLARGGGSALFVLFVPFRALPPEAFAASFVWARAAGVRDSPLLSALLAAVLPVSALAWALGCCPGLSCTGFSLEMSAAHAGCWPPFADPGTTV